MCVCKEQRFILNKDFAHQRLIVIKDSYSSSYVVSPSTPISAFFCLYIYILGRSADRDPRVRGGRRPESHVQTGNTPPSCNTGEISRRASVHSIKSGMTHSHVTWLVHMWHDLVMCDITHIYVAWLIHMWHDSSIRDMTRLSHDPFIRDITHTYMRWLIPMLHDSFLCDMTHSYVTRLIHTWHDSIHTRHDSILMWHDSYICKMTQFIGDMTHSYVT